MNTNHTNSVHRSTVNIPYRARREQICTARFNGERISRAGRIEKGITHKPCKTGLSVPAIKTDKVYSRQPGPIRTSDPRGYNTGNVPPSYGPEDGNIYDQETIEISTNKVCNTPTRKPGRGPQTGKILTEK